MRYNYQFNLRPQTHCAVCQKALYGRSDKVFCDITCKNHYHADHRKKFRTIASESYRRCKKNHHILSYLIGKRGKQFEISLIELKRLGFDLETVSGVQLENEGVILKIYEFSLTIKNKNTVLVTIDESDKNISPFIYRRWVEHASHLQTLPEQQINDIQRLGDG